MMMLRYMLLAVIFIHSSTLSGSIEYYVKPDTPDNHTCTVQICYTLKDIALNHTQLSGQDDVSLKMLEGTHVIELGNSVRFSDIRLLHITGDSKKDVIVLTSYNFIGFEFKNIAFLKIKNLQMNGLKLKFFSTDRAILDELYMNLIAIHISSGRIDITGSQVIDCWSIQFTTQQNSSNNSLVTALSFLNSTLLYTNEQWITIEHICRMPSRDVQVLTETNCKSMLIFSRCTIDENHMTIFVKNGGDLDLEFVRTMYHGNMNVITDGSNVSLIINKCKVYPLTSEANAPSLLTTLSNSFLLGIRASELQRYLVKIVTARRSSNNVITVSITDTTIQTKKIVDGLLVMAESLQGNRVNIIINDSIITNSRNALYFRKTGDHNIQTAMTSESIFIISLRNATVKENRPTENNPVVKAVNVNRILVEDCKFVNNKGTAIEVYISDIFILGNTVFANNSGTRGGALGLYNSYIVLSNGTNVTFYNNFAEKVGGAIYVQVFEDRELFLCFYLIDGEIGGEENAMRTIDFWFQGNSAKHGGDNIYGGTLYGRCKIYIKERNFKTQQPGEYYYGVSKEHHTQSFADNIFHFDSTNILSSVTSRPKRVCLCDEQGTPRCADEAYNYAILPSRYPGEVFTIPAVVVGYDFGTVPGTVFISILDEQAATVVHEYSNHHKCAKFNFSIESQLTNITKTIKLTTSQNDDDDMANSDIFTKYNQTKIIEHELLQLPVLLNVSIKECPIGFQIANAPPYICKCHPTLARSGITVCVLTNYSGLVYRSGTIWASASSRGKGFVIHQHCPYNYCMRKNISIDLNHPDRQCALNHSGILCGGCYGNLSLVLGTSRCLPCDNRYISLTIVFILAGLGLFFFVKALDLTVTRGAVYRLIFYANIVWANRSILFPLKQEVHPALQILHTFIAWLNLDLGIETCYIDGLNGYWKAWLQFVFTVYIWAISVVVIIAAQYSIKVGRIFGNNSVPVLATLIYISYAKLLRTIITCFGFSVLEYSDGRKMVWSFDGNVPFFGAAHLILFLIALVVFIVLWLPYTTVLLSLQSLRRKSHLKPLRWINRWKPFFDAYLGQLKPKHQYWVGLLLLVRTFLLVLFAVTSAIEPKINILAMALTGMILLIYSALAGLVYKSYCLSFLEDTFLANLTLLGILKLYYKSNRAANILIYISTGIVFFEFILIVMYHTWSRIRTTYATYRRRHSDNTDTSTHGDLRRAVCVHQNHMHYREPLLDSSVQGNDQN